MVEHCGLWSLRLVLRAEAANRAETREALHSTNAQPRGEAVTAVRAGVYMGPVPRTKQAASKSTPLEAQVPGQKQLLRKLVHVTKLRNMLVHLLQHTHTVHAYTQPPRPQSKAPYGRRRRG